MTRPELDNIVQLTNINPHVLVYAMQFDADSMPGNPYGNHAGHNQAAHFAGRYLLGFVMREHFQVADALDKVQTDQFGRPYFIGSLESFHFSINHTNDMAMVAVSQTHKVGVDLEASRQKVRFLEIACCFSEKEKTYLTRLPGYMQNEAVLQIWVRKEAVAKLIGKGHFVDFSRLHEHTPVDATIRMERISLQGRTFYLALATQPVSAQARLDESFVGASNGAIA